MIFLIFPTPITLVIFIISIIKIFHKTVFYLVKFLFIVFSETMTSFLSDCNNILKIFKTI
ncbi:hypothetical protein A0H76_2211 [Hepatospora eriocheir]|uniref:Uncharacterized protein n=1 Tax=Hepatospora eriocheir TaxID=1081669 RepID=A0A1X0QK17_9MICR|nr:hypothetical protein A0H76_2211 [Hepatospora eriocheir]